MAEGKSARYEFEMNIETVNGYHGNEGQIPLAGVSADGAKLAEDEAAQLEQIRLVMLDVLCVIENVLDGCHCTRKAVQLKAYNWKEARVNCLPT